MGAGPAAGCKDSVMRSACGQVVYRKTNGVKLSHCTPFPLTSDSARSSSLWLDAVSNKEEILAPL